MEGCTGFLLIQLGHPVSGEAEVVQRDGDPKSCQELGHSHTRPPPCRQARPKARPSLLGRAARLEASRLAWAHF